MPDNPKRPKNETQNGRKSIFDRLFAKPSRDETYISDLKAQWASMNRADRIKFVLGVIIGLALFIGALLLAYLALSSLFG
jgi:hypothetical protein